MSSVVLSHISKHYGAVKALDDVSLSIADGELVALLGPSGCGKTTLLRSIAGLEKPDGGVVQIGGTDMTHVPARKRPIGMVFQSYVLFPNMTIRDNVGFPLKMRGDSKQAIRARADELLELMGLAQQGDRYPNQVSGGQQQRAALARALAANPSVLLLDEPLSALDALVRTRLRDEIRRIQQLVKITAVYVTHDQGEAMAIADRVAVMNAGKIEQLAAPAQIYDDPSTRFAAGFVGNRNILELRADGGMARLGKAFAVQAPAGSSIVAAFFRPEDVVVSMTGEDQQAMVENKMFQGLLTRLYLVVEADGTTTRIYADLPSRQAEQFTQGSTVNVRVAAADVRVFPAD